MLNKHNPKKKLDAFSAFEKAMAESKQEEISAREALFKKHADIIAELQKHVVLIQGGDIWVDLALWDNGAASVWRKYNQSQFIQSLKNAGVDKTAAPQVFAFLKDHTDTRVVDAARDREFLPLHPAGFHIIDKRPWFIHCDSAPVTPVKGDPTVIVRALCRMFGNETPLLLGWLKGALMRQLNFAASIRGEEPPYPPKASQCLVVCGLQNTGKTHFFLEHVVKPLLGGCAPMQKSWLIEENRFNSWALDAPVYVADDSVKLANEEQRMTAAGQVKQLGYAQGFTVELKQVSPMTMSFPNERIFCCNLSPAALAALPDFSSDRDKVLMLYNGAECGFSADYNGDSMKLCNAADQAIPAFAHFLLHELELPAWTNSSDLPNLRHVVADFGYASPAVRNKVRFTDEADLLFRNLVSALKSAVWPDDCCGKPLVQKDIRELLAKCGFSYSKASPEAMGRMLSFLADRHKGLITRKVVKGSGRYSFAPRDAWKDLDPNDGAMMVPPPLDQKLLDLAGLSRQDITFNEN